MAIPISTHAIQPPPHGTPRLPCTCSATQRSCPACQAYGAPKGSPLLAPPARLSAAQQAVLRALTAPGEWHATVVLAARTGRRLSHIRETLRDLVAMGKVERREAKQHYEYRLVMNERGHDAE